MPEETEAETPREPETAEKRKAREAHERAVAEYKKISVRGLTMPHTTKKKETENHG